MKGINKLCGQFPIDFCCFLVLSLKNGLDILLMISEKMVMSNNKQNNLQHPNLPYKLRWRKEWFVLYLLLPLQALSANEALVWLDMLFVISVTTHMDHPDIPLYIEDEDGQFGDRVYSPF
jgi:hypothetical protein